MLNLLLSCQLETHEEPKYLFVDAFFIIVNWNITEFTVNLGTSINWSSAIIGIAGALFAIYIWFYERETARKATLFIPLFLVCRNIIEIINNYEDLGWHLSKDQFNSCAEALDKIVYTYGSAVHLKKWDDLKTFMDLKTAIDNNRRNVEKEHWENLRDMFKNDEFKKINNYATTLLSKCKEELKDN